MSARLGNARLRYDDQAPFIDTDKSSPFAKLSAGWYPSADLRLALSAQRRFEQNAFGLEAEFQLPGSRYLSTKMPDFFTRRSFVFSPVVDCLWAS